MRVQSRECLLGRHAKKRIDLWDQEPLDSEVILFASGLIYVYIFTRFASPSKHWAYIACIGVGVISAVLYALYRQVLEKESNLKPRKQMNTRQSWH